MLVIPPTDLMDIAFNKKISGYRLEIGNRKHCFAPRYNHWICEQESGPFEDRLVITISEPEVDTDITYSVFNLLENYDKIDLDKFIKTPFSGQGEITRMCGDIPFKICSIACYPNA